MAFTYGTPIALKRDEEDENGLRYGDEVPMVFGDYSKATYGESIDLFDLDPVTPTRERSIMVNRPILEEFHNLQGQYGPGSRLSATERMLTSSAPGGGLLGLPPMEERLEQKYPGVKEKMDAMEEAAWAGQEESSWGEVFGNTLRNILPKFRRQILGGFIGGNPPTMEQLQANADLELGQMGSGRGDISQSIENQRIAKEWGFEEGSDKVPAGADPVQLFSEWLQTEEGTAEIEAEAKSKPISTIAEEIYDVETDKINENAIQVKPQSLKYYAAGILDAGINMGPAMAATILTRNPNVGAVIMGGQVYGDTYSDMRKRGYSHDQAMMAGLYSAAAETLTERIALGVLTSNKFTGLKRILAGASAEGIQEPVTEALQIGYDVGILNDEMTMGEAMWRLIDAGIIGFGVGGGMGAGVEVMEQVSTPAAREANEYDTLIDSLQLNINREAEENRALAELEGMVDELDNAINEAAKDLAPEQLDALEAEKLIKVRDDGTVQVLPKGRRRLAAQQAELQREQKKALLREAGVLEEDTAPTVEILDTAPVFAVAEADTDVTPTESQKLAGNYRKGRFTWNNIPIALENPAGSVRSGTNRQGVKWSQTMNSGYGYFPSKPGADTVKGEPTEGVDVYVGPDLTIPMAYVINQAVDPSKEAVGENFDEHKVMIGYPSMEAAIDAYKLDYEPARGQEIEGVRMEPMQFKGWLNEPVHEKPISQGEREGYDKAPVFATVEETKPTAERYRMRGKKVIGMSPKAGHSLRGVNNQIEKTVAILEDSALIPAEAWTWYEDSGRKIREITRGDPELMHDVIKILAATSQGVSVGANTTFMIKAAYQIAKGEQIDTGMYPATAVPNIETMRVLKTGEITNELPGIGSKVMSFYRNLYDATYNTNLYDGDVTIDRWMTRNLGYKSESVEGTQYDYARKIFQDAVARYNAKNGTNWLPRHAQAALWVHERSKASLKKTGKETPVDAFAEHIEAATASVTHESMPSLKTLDGMAINALPREEKQELGRRQREALADNNTHVVMEALGVPLYKVETAIGGYQGMINPNEISNIVMVGGAEIDRPTVDVFSTIMQYIYTQDSVPWFRAERKAKTSEKTGDFGAKYTQGVNWDLQGPLSEDQETELFDALRKALGPDAGFSMAALDQLVIIDFKDEKGVTVSGLKPAEFIEKIDQILDNMGADLGVVNSYSFGAEGNNLEHNWEADPNGQELETAIENYASTRGPSDLLQRVRDWRASAQGITSDFLEAKRRPRAGAAAPVPVDRLDDRTATEDAVFERFGSVDRTRDTTEELKYYNLTPIVENPALTDRLAAAFGYNVEVFSYEPGNFRIPRLGKQNYVEGTVWIYDPAAAHGSFKDTEYTRAWRVSHEISHGITERYMQERYGDSKRYGRLGRTMMGERGAPPKQVEVELEPLTLMQAQRAVEWEDVTFRVQRILLDRMGISIPDATFNQEANVNMADAVFRTVTGDFADAGEFGFRPTVISPTIKAVLTGLERTERDLATEQGRDATEGIDLATYAPITDAQLDEAIELQSKVEPGVPLFAVEPTVRPGVPVENLKAVVEEAFQLYPNSPNVKIASTEADMPSRQLREIKHAGMEGKIGGLFDPDTGTIYLIAANLSSMKGALEIYLHEAVGHYGLRSVLGAEYDVEMDKILKAFPTKVRAAGKRNGLDMRKTQQRRIAAEEFIAYTAQQILAGNTVPARELSLLQSLMEALRIALARLRGVQFSEVDMQRLIRKARLFVATPNAKGKGMLRNRKPPVMFSGLWLAMNNERVPMSAQAQTYRDELNAQIRAGNISEEDAEPLVDYLTSQTGILDKADFMEQIRELGNQNPFAVVEEAVYEVIDRQTGERVGTTYKGKNARKRVRTRADKLDLEYGAIRYQVRQISPEPRALFHSEEYDGRREAIETGDLYEGFTIDEGSKKSQAWNYLVFKAQDKFIDLLNVQKAIEMQSGRPVDEQLDAYLSEELYHGRVKSRIDRFDKEYIKPLIDSIEDSNYTWDEVEWYLYARHAPEANAALYKINKATPAMVKKYEQALEDAYDDATRAAAQAEFRQAIAKRLEEKPELKSLSGMSNEDAALVMETMRDKGDIGQLENIAGHIDRMTARNREIMVDEGLETQETVDAWEAAYDHYVPLKGFKDGPMNTTFFPKKGKGYDTGGKLNQRRLGRKSLAANIMANIVAQHQSAVILAEKSKVGRTLLEMVQKHPNPDLWTANEVEYKKRLDKKTGLVVTAVDPTYKLKDNVLRVKVEGKDYHITFNEESPVAMRIASSMKNMSSQEINFFFQALLGLNRVLSAVNTSFNPEFIVTNLVRDLQTAMINLNATEANKMKMAIFKDVFKAHRGIRRFLDLPSFKNKEAADYWRTQFEEYRDLGGQVGWIDNYKDVKDLEASLYREMHDRTAGMVSWATLRRMGRYIEGENQAIENSVRLSAFVHAKTAGLSPRKAASLAKNLTVNFNRKGDAGTSLNALYLFYNASIQGMAIMYKSAKSPKVRKIMYGIIAFAAALEIINRMLAGDDDAGDNRYDKIPAWVKERNLIIMLPEGIQADAPDDFTDHFITIPLPYGYNILHTMGRKIGGIIDYTGIGNKREWKPMEDAAELMASILGSFNPIGTGPTPLQTIIPTFLLPLVQSSENVAWHGGPVMPPLDAWDPSPTPESQQFYRSVPEHAKALAEFLNKLGGGTRARPADLEFLDISPETIQLWEDFLTGGAGRFVTNSIELGIMAKENEVDFRKVPFARRFIGVTDERSVSNRYYEHRTEIEYAVQEIKVAGEQVMLATTKEDRADAMEERARIIGQYQADAALQPTLRLISEHLKRLNVQRKAIESSRRDDEWKEEQVEKIDLKKTQLMNNFNKKYNEIMQRRREADEQVREHPTFNGKERLAAVRQLNQGGYPAMAALIRSLPTNPKPDFVEKLHA